jgi:hypothetical protein
MSADPTLAEVEAMVAEVVAMVRSVSRAAWTATPDEMRFLEEVAAFTGPPLPPAAFESGAVARSFLLSAQASLEVTARQLLDEDSEQ